MTPTAWQGASRLFTTPNERSGPAFELFRFRDQLCSQFAVTHNLCALTPLFWSNVNPFGRFRLDMERHLDLELAPPVLPAGPALATAE